VPSQPTSAGLVVGSVASAATTGALVAIGHRLGSAAVPFAAISAVLFHRTVSGGAVGLVFTGLILHAFVIFAWSATFVWLVRRLGFRAIAAACGVGIAALVLSWIVARSTGGGLSSVLPLGDRLVYGLVLAAALVLGIRFAFFPSQRA
jgi:hypothetical protein